MLREDTPAGEPASVPGHGDQTFVGEEEHHASGLAPSYVYQTGL